MPAPYDSMFTALSILFKSYVIVYFDHYTLQFLKNTLIKPKDCCSFSNCQKYVTFYFHGRRHFWCQIYEYEIEAENDDGGEEEHLPSLMVRLNESESGTGTGTSSGIVSGLYFSMDEAN